MSDDLVKRLRDLGDHASFEPHMHHTAADRIDELEAKLAKLKLERNYANDVIDSYVAQVSDLEAKLQSQTHLIEQLFVMLDKREETDDGRIFHPNELRSCRASDTEKLNKILAELRGPMKGQDDD